MKAEIVPCGPYANESEKRAAITIKTKLENHPGDGLWLILTNVEFASKSSSRPDEIDLLVIGPTGIHLIETKHWDGKYVDNRANTFTVEDQSDILQRKARRLAGRVKQMWPEANFIEGKFLLTKGESISYFSTLAPCKGVKFFALRDWQDLLAVGSRSILDNRRIQQLAQELCPRAKVNITGDIRHFGAYTNLELKSASRDRFHRVYRGLNARTQDRVLLHVYDYSADQTSANPDTIARREYETVQRLQKSPWLPRLMESFQEAPEYPGELFFFSLIDPAAPSIAERKSDKEWKVKDRIRFSAQAFAALADLHEPSDAEDPVLLHRNFSPNTIHVRANGKPLFTGLTLTRIADLTTLPASAHPVADDQYSAPELKRGGLSEATKSSDVYSMCLSLKELFGDRAEGHEALAALELGLQQNPADRAPAGTISAALTAIVASQADRTAGGLPAAKYWDEGTQVVFNEATYRVVSKLGAGGWGTAFKVVEIDPTGDEDFGTYVAKVIHSRDEGNSAIRAYKKIRAHTTHKALSVIHEIASTWSADAFVAVLRWIDGIPLSMLNGELTDYANRLGEEQPEELVLRWLRVLCEALASMHDAGFAHCDVSPKNIIVSGEDVFLTDYDLCTRIGTRSIAKGTLAYCSPAMQSCDEVSFRDDLFALGASFFHVLCDVQPFEVDGELRKSAGLSWSDEHRNTFPRLVEFLDRCVNTSNTAFNSAHEAVEYLDRAIASYERALEQPIEKSPEKTKNEIPWLNEVLKAYPKSRFGNAETRGLDSDFAKNTYVQTGLEKRLFDDILRRKTKLVILTGNAGDGKTAFLQHLAASLGVDIEASSFRVVDQLVHDGLRVRINLDGSASFKGKTASQLLDDFFSPFQGKGDPDNLVHLLAINSGPLLSWIEDFSSRAESDGELVEALSNAINGDLDGLPSWLEFIDFNERSLVGGISADGQGISTKFVSDLLDLMLGGDEAANIWKACDSCSAAPSCPISDTISRVRGVGAYTTQDRDRLRERLFDALQAVHQKGQVHITARDLRAALSYIVFGLHNCRDIHTGITSDFSPLWDRAFSAKSPRRQGELLAELATVDPAIESNAKIDRYLLGAISADATPAEAPRYTHLTLSSARRRAYFEWTDNAIEKLTSVSSPFGLKNELHAKQFREFPFLSHEEQENICRNLCRGLSRLVDLPSIVLDQTTHVPLRITPRTPTETVFWVNKPISRFRLHCPATKAKDIDFLHTRLFLEYSYETGSTEQLDLSSDLFSILMQLNDGYQFADAALDDTFANLSIFIGRLAQENQSELFCWNPSSENAVYRIAVDTGSSDRAVELQVLGAKGQ